MADPKRVEVELSGFVSDLPPRGMKGLASAPITHRADRLLDVFRLEARRYWPVGHGDLVSALIYATDPDRATLTAMIENYREAHVWEILSGLGETIPKEGKWEVDIRGQGQRSSG